MDEEQSIPFKKRALRVIPVFIGAVSIGALFNFLLGLPFDIYFWKIILYFALFFLGMTVLGYFFRNQRLFVLKK